ncbi:M15 family metallopeptidase [Sinorhizobium meliloti]|nr:M15 family metallopeptidase [Sinorhizobium meliloti]
MLDGEIAANQIGVENQKYRSDMTSAKSVLLESLNLAENDRAALARQGGVDTKEYRDAYAKTRTLWNELSAEPAFGISPREAEIKLKAAQDRDSGEAILGEADRALDVGGIAEARRLADNILTSTAVSLSPSERRKYSGLINQSIKSYQSEQRAAVLPLKDLAKDRVKEWEAGIGLDSTDDAMLIENIRKGDPSYASYLTSRLTSARQVRDVRNLGDRAQVKLLEETAGRFAPEEITVAKTFLKGRTDKDATHIDGMQDAFAVKLSRMFEAAPPEIKAGLGVYSGARSVERQRELWQQALAKYGSVDEARRWVAPPGNSQHNHGNAADLSYNGQSLKNAPANVVAWLHENANSYGLKFPLSNENWHIEDDSTRGGKSIPLVGAAAKTLQSEVAADLRRDLGDWETRLKRGDVPDQDSLNLMTRQLALVDDQDLRSQYQTMFRNSQAFQEGFQANPAAVESFLGSLDARAAGSGASLAELQILDSARAGAEAAATMKRNDGLGYAMRTYPNFPKMPMLDVNNPSSYETTLRQYQNGVNIAQAGGEMTNIPAFRPAQAQAVARMWQRGDASQLGALTDAFASSLNPETLRATLTTGPIKEALGGAILSTDPVKHQAAMQQLDLLSAKVSIPQLEADFGKDAVDRLQDWQAKVRYFTPEETADWLKQRNDPKWSDRTKPLVRKGEDEARKVSAADIIDKLDTNRWFDAAGPIDEQTRRWMMNDYVTLVGDRNASLDNVDTAKTQAIERMSKRWGVTSVYGDRGGRVMPYPPESYYPDVNGSKDWIGRELQGIAASRNIDISTLSLISDQKTEAAARAGEMPGYMMTAVDPKTGLEDLVTDEQGRPLRHFFDPRAAQGSILSDAQRARQNLGPAAVQQRIDETFARDPVPPGSFLLNQGSE